MVVVRNCFIAKPGCASTLAGKLKEAAATVDGGMAFRVLTDLTGDFNRVILEYEAADVAAFDARMKDYASNSAFRDKLQGYTDLYMTGTREILQIF